MKKILSLILVSMAFSATASAQQPDLSIWKDAEFQRRFNEGLLAESEVEPTVSEEERESIQEVLILMADENIDQAIVVLGKLIGKNESAVFDFTLGHLLFQKERYDQAAIAFASAARKYPKYLRAWNYLGQTYVRVGRFKEAIKPLTRVIELGGSSGVTYGVLGFAHSNLGNYISAESAYRMAVLLDPQTKDWQMGLARSFYKQRRYPELASFCDSLLAQDPEAAELWMLQANAFLGLGKPLEAAQNFEMIAGMGKATVASSNALGDIYINEGLFDLGVAAYLNAVNLVPAGAIDRPLAAARNLVLNGGVKETTFLLDGLERIKGDAMLPSQKKEILKLRSRVAVAEGGGAREAEVLEQVVALDPLDGEALILLGHYYRRNDDAVKATAYFERASEISGFEAKANLGKAQVLVGQGKYKEALPLLRRAQQIDPQDHVQKYLEQIEIGAKTMS